MASKPSATAAVVANIFETVIRADSFGRVSDDAEEKAIKVEEFVDKLIQEKKEYRNA